MNRFTNLFDRGIIDHYVVILSKEINTMLIIFVTTHVYDDARNEQSEREPGCLMYLGVISMNCWSKEPWSMLDLCVCSDWLIFVAPCLSSMHALKWLSRKILYNNRCHAISYWWKRDKGDIRMAKSTVQIKVERTYNLTTTREIKIAAAIPVK